MPEISHDVVLQDNPVEPVLTKGRARLNNNQDIDILEIVRDATFITKHQLKYLCERRGIAKSRGTFNWRFNRLVSTKLITPLPTLIYPFNSPVFTIARTGLFVLEKFGRGLASITSESEHLASSKQAYHFLELNEIIFQFDRCFQLDYAMCDRVLRSRNLSLSTPLAKDYDALLKINRSTINKEPLNVGVEFEVNVKSSERYKDVSASLSAERFVRLVVYLCGSVDVVNLLTEKITSRSAHICFGTSSDFLRDGNQTAVIFIQKGEKHTVGLQRLIELA